MEHAMLRRSALWALLCAMAGCATQGPLQPNYVVAPKVLTQGGLVQIINGTGYLSYQSPTPRDAPGYRYVRRARGEVCQNDLQLPLHLQGSHQLQALDGPQTLKIIWGSAAVAAGVEDAMNGAPRDAVLYDLTLDLHHTSVFGLFFRRQCLVVSGSLAVPQAPLAPHAEEAQPLSGGTIQPGATVPAPGEASAPAPDLVPVAPALAPLPIPPPHLHDPSHEGNGHGHPSAHPSRRARRHGTTHGHKGGHREHKAHGHSSSSRKHSQD